ncbi:MAG: hypothetical protein NWF01_12065 [Candidatus Bathyarchaeota archaeon]|nr:hypothetical protein [Candidatus Bathyarchaeota archaeon]
MQAVSIILFIISVGIIVGPIGVVVLTSSNDLTQLVIPPEIKDKIIGDNSPLHGGGGGDNNSTGNDSGGIAGLITPEIVSQSIDISQKSATVTLNFKNDLGFDMTVNTLQAEIQDKTTGQTLGTISLTNPVIIASGETNLATIQGLWNDNVEEILGQAQSINANLVNLTVDIDGVIIQLSEFNIGDIPLNY